MSVFINPGLYINPTQQNISASVLTNKISPIIPYYNIPLVPTVSSVNNYSVLMPMYPAVSSYPDISNDRNIRKQMTEYFYDKLIRSWIRNYFAEIFKLIVVNNGKASLIKNLNEASNNNKNDANENGIKSEFLLDNYLTKKDIFRLLEKFRRINSISWLDLKQHPDKIRKYIQYKVTKYLKAHLSK
jgi:hypothetical protein